MQRDILYLAIIAFLSYQAFFNLPDCKGPAPQTYPTSSNFLPNHYQNVSETESPTRSEEPFQYEEETPSTEVSDASPGSTYFWISLGVSVLLVLFGGTMSGLTVGYLSIDELQLELKMTNGTEEEKKNAKIIIPILAKHHLLLCTLLLANAFAMEALPIFLDAIMPAFAAIIVSTSAVVVFGEIVPQAYCTGPNQIKIARRLAPLIKVIMFLLFPICYPISLVLDKLLGTHHKTRFVKKDLKTLISLHEESATRISIIDQNPINSHAHDHEHPHDEECLTMDEVKVITSTIDLRDTPVTKEMETFEKVFMISSTEVIDQELLKKISLAGYSKVPVYKNGDKHQVIGFIRVKTLLEYKKYKGKSLEESGIRLKAPLVVAKDTSMLEMLMLFQEKRTGVGLISNDTVKDKDMTAFTYSKDVEVADQSRIQLIGLISLKDIFEEILESQMMDEDVHCVPCSNVGLRLKIGKEGAEYTPSPRRRDQIRRDQSSSPRTRRYRKDIATPTTDLTMHLLDPANEA